MVARDVDLPSTITSSGNNNQQAISMGGEKEGGATKNEE